tara:strand:- start:577 stop:1458 length:882 start_codon:yes stop_codon:yes gene_type:complete
MKNYTLKQMKNLLIRTTTSLSILSLSLFNAKPGLTETVYGSNSTRPDSLKVTFYQLGISNSDFTKVFSVLDSESGQEVDISNQNSVNDMASGVKPAIGTYTHFFAVISNTYKMKGSANGCYTKNISVNKSNAVFDASITKENGVTTCTNCQYDGWSAATSNSAEFGEASLREQAYGVQGDGEPDFEEAYGPVVPLTNLTVGGNEVISAKMYLTNSSNPYSIVEEGTAINALPASSTRDRSLYFGELSSSVIVSDDSEGIVQIYFDYSNGLAFDDDCDAVVFNSGDFDMSVITE